MTRKSEKNRRQQCPPHFLRFEDEDFEQSRPNRYGGNQYRRNPGGQGLLCPEQTAVGGQKH
jgi:hypothetical protein